MDKPIDVGLAFDTLGEAKEYGMGLGTEYYIINNDVDELVTNSWTVGELIKVLEDIDKNKEVRVCQSLFAIDNGKVIDLVKRNDDEEEFKFYF